MEPDQPVMAAARDAVTGVVLAAGAGRRLGRPKAEVLVGGRRLIDRAVRTLRDGGCAEVIAVVRSSQVAAEGARLVVNPEPDEGMGSSLRCALAASSTSQAWVVLLVDLPAVTAAEVSSVIGAYRGGADLVAIRRAGQRSHPVLVSRRWLPEFAAAAVGDSGGRRFFAEHLAETTFIDLAEPTSDIDTEEDLRLADQPPPL